MAVRAGVTTSETGLPNSEWRTVPLGAIATISHGYGFESRYFAQVGDVLLTTAGNFREEGGFRSLGDKQKYYDGPIPTGFVLQPGDLIVAMTEQADGLLGSAAFVPTHGRWLHNQRIGRVSVTDPGTCVNLLYRLFNSGSFRARVRETAAGTKVKHTSPGRLLDITVRVPPTLVEQEAIAGALSDADALIESLEQLIGKRRDVKQGAMHSLLTGAVRLPGHGSAWEVQTIGGLAEFRPGEYLAQSAYRPGPVAVQGAGSIMGWHDVANFPEAVSVVGRVGTVGKPRFMPRGCWVNNNAAAMQAIPARATPAYLHSILETIPWNLVVSTTAQPFLEVGTLLQLAFSVPSVPEQTAIATVLSDMDAEIAALEAKLAKARLVKQGMMQELLTGRTRLA